mgnify:CR=1 FL=1
MQVGSGVITAAVKSLFTQGSISRTGLQTDLFISGNGYFVVRDSVNDLQYATRAGDFRLQGGYLVTNNGLRVQGFSDAGLTTRGDVQMDGTGRPDTSDPTASVTGYNIDAEGKLTLLGSRSFSMSHRITRASSIRLSSMQGSLGKIHHTGISISIRLYRTIPMGSVRVRRATASTTIPDSPTNCLIITGPISTRGLI